MSFFDDRKNRILLAGFLTASGLLELMFFGYAMEGLYSPLYHVLADLAVIAAVQPLIVFLAPKRAMSCVFVGIGCFICAAFPAMTASWQGLGIEEGILTFVTGAFWLRVLRYALLSFGSVFAGSLLKDGQKCAVTVPAACAAIAFVFAVAGGENAAYALFLAACAVLARAICVRAEGEDIHLRLPQILLLIFCFAACCALFYAYADAKLLTEEAACGADLLFVLAGMVVSLMGYRYGLYVYYLVPLRLCLGYAGGWLRGDVDAGYLFGMIPAALLFAAGMLALMKGGKKEAAEANAAPAAAVKKTGKTKYDG